jgi:hypothetical protein
MKGRAASAGWAALLAALLVLSSACLGIRHKASPGLSPLAGPASKQSPEEKRILQFLEEIWSSGFLADTPRVRAEVQNNQYKIYEKEKAFADLGSGRAYFLMNAAPQDQILLSKSLLGGLVYSPLKRKIRFKHTDRRIHETLVHELFHDFWFNILDGSERSAFSVEAERLIRDIELVSSKKDRLDFLARAGYSKPDENFFKAYADLLLAKREYGNYMFYRYECFPVLAAKAFARELIIPPELRRFYAGIISDEYLK